MGKKTITGTKNVYELAQERLKVIFNEFDNIYVSFSGGKDSGVLLNMCIDYIRRNNLKIRLGVFHMDYEIQYKMTIDYVDRILEANKDILDVYRVCVPFRVSTCTSMYQSFWRPWEDNKKDIWVRSMPKKAMKKEDFPFYNTTMWDYEFQMRFAQWIHQKKDAVRTCCLIGIRTQESFNRWRCIYMSRKFQMYHKYKWTSKVGNDIYNAYPIFDWKTTDVWTANGKFQWDYNILYDLYYRAGVNLERQRVASPFITGESGPLSGTRPQHMGKDDRKGEWSELHRYVRRHTCDGLAVGETARRLYLARVHVFPVVYLAGTGTQELSAKTVCQRTFLAD